MSEESTNREISGSSAEQEHWKRYMPGNNAEPQQKTVSQSTDEHQSDVEQQDVHPHYKTVKRSAPKKKYYSMILIGCVTLCVIAAAIAMVLSVASPEEPQTSEEPEYVEVDPTIETIKPLGNISLSGNFGSAKIIFNFDSETGSGERFYALQSDEVYTLIIKSAELNDDGSYTVQIKELLKGRIEIGTYTGILTQDSFIGEYASNHGDKRTVNLVKE